jgi:hypothetical protein
MDIKSRWDSVTAPATWRARGGSFVAKVHATRAIWFPAQEAKSAPKKVAKTASRTARKTTRTASKKTGTGSASRRTAKKAADKAS